MDCYNKSRTFKPEITDEELLLLIYNSSFSAVGRQFGVSCNAVQKWVKKMGIPHTIKELKKYIEANILK